MPLRGGRGGDGAVKEDVMAVYTFECGGCGVRVDKVFGMLEVGKLGPGDSARSHTADEFIYLKEIEQGIDCYIQIIEKLILSK